MGPAYSVSTNQIATTVIQSTFSPKRFHAVWITFSFISQVQFLNSPIIDHSSNFLRERNHFQGKNVDSFISLVFPEDNQPNNDYCYEIAEKKSYKSSRRK